MGTESQARVAGSSGEVADANGESRRFSAVETELTMRGLVQYVLGLLLLSVFGASRLRRLQRRPPKRFTASSTPGTPAIPSPSPRPFTTRTSG